MSSESLGTNYTCDTCGKVVHTDGWIPAKWTKLKITTEHGVTGVIPDGVIEICFECRGDIVELKKNIAKQWIEFFKNKDWKK